MAGRLAEALARRAPDRLTTEFYKEKRKGRLLLDINRNAYQQHAVAPYSLRALPGAPVAAPLEWSEARNVVWKTPVPGVIGPSSVNGEPAIKATIFHLSWYGGAPASW